MRTFRQPEKRVRRYNKGKGGMKMKKLAAILLALVLLLPMAVSAASPSGFLLVDSGGARTYLDQKSVRIVKTAPPFYAVEADVYIFIPVSRYFSSRHTVFTYEMGRNPAIDRKETYAEWYDPRGRDVMERSIEENAVPVLPGIGPFLAANAAYRKAYGHWFSQDEAEWLDDEIRRLNDTDLGGMTERGE